MHDHHVGVELGQVAQHPHYGGDATAGGEEQDLGRYPLAGRVNSPVAWSSWTTRTGGRAADEVIADHTVRNGLHGDGDAAVTSAGFGEVRE